MQVFKKIVWKLYLLHFHQDHLKDAADEKKQESSHIWTHAKEEHGGEESFQCKVLRTQRSAFERQVSEAVSIRLLKQQGVNVLNTKREYNRCLLPELMVELGNRRQTSNEQGESPGESVPAAPSPDKTEATKEDMSWFVRGRSLEDGDEAETKPAAKKMKPEKGEGASPEDSGTPSPGESRDLTSPKGYSPQQRCPEKDSSVGYIKTNKTLQNFFKTPLK